MSGEVEFKPPEEAIELPMPRVTLWRLLVEPYKPPKTLASGLIMPDDVVESAALLTIVGQIRAMGDQCFQKESLKDRQNPGIGDWIIYGKYAGQVIHMADGREFRVIDDDKIIAIVDDPATLKGYY